MNRHQADLTPDLNERPCLVGIVAGSRLAQPKPALISQAPATLEVHELSKCLLLYVARCGVVCYMTVP